MNKNGYFAYIRVSTPKQGSVGTSLTQQRAAIENYALRFGLQVTKQFEERETAAKQGRPVFLEMLEAVRKGDAKGIIIHKIDRSARNLRDWADLMDSGVEVHFANESLDLNSRGGRLSADIQAVVAADFIRNLREETKKGILGRLKQGLYPFPARVGYLDRGAGKPKTPDPIQAPLVEKAFELYADGDIGLNALAEKMYDLGMRNKSGNKISRNGLSGILKNPFYIGLIRVDSMGEVFAGKHQPIISRKLFDQVQAVIGGKTYKRKVKHNFLFRRLVSCSRCENVLIGERQKGYVYYRCHTRDCPQKTVREELIEESLVSTYSKLQLTDQEYAYLKSEAARYREEEPKRIKQAQDELTARLTNSEKKLERLVDGYVEGVLDKETYLAKRNRLISEKQEIDKKLRQVDVGQGESLARFNQFLEFVKSACLSYEKADTEGKREMVKITTSNFYASDKSLSIKLRNPFEILFERQTIPVGSPQPAETRTLNDLYLKLTVYFKTQSTFKNLLGH
ncbi:MAG: recombinase family protein [Aridibacter famidurans]|nr:recombinase family protein [Aridibacter famidurans]